MGAHSACCAVCGRVAWVLRTAGSQFAIRTKRIDLVDADQALPALTFLL